MFLLQDTWDGIDSRACIAHVKTPPAKHGGGLSCEMGNRQVFCGLSVGRGFRDLYLPIHHRYIVCSVGHWVRGRRNASEVWQ